QTKSFQAQVTPANAQDKTYSFYSKDTGIAGVDSALGNAIGVAKGQTQICVVTNDGSFEDCANLTVFQQAESLSFSPASLTLMAGTQANITASVLPSSADFKGVSFSSSNPNIFTVSSSDASSGSVTGVSAGQATLNAVSEDGFATGSVSVTILPRPEQVSISPQNPSLKTGRSLTFSSSVLPENTPDNKVRYSSSDPQIATIDAQTGLVMGVSAGQVTIQAETTVSHKTGQTTLTVRQSVEGVTLTSDKTDLDVGQSTQLQLSVSPDNAYDKSVIYSSSAPSVASVDNQGSVKALSKGSVTITVTTNDGGFTDSVTLQIIKRVTGVTVSPKSLSLEKELAYDLTALVEPLDADERGVIWQSSAPSIVSVDSSGQITARQIGQANITVKTLDGNFIDTSVITVVSEFVPVQKINLTPSNPIEINLGGQQTLSAEVLPANATDKSVKYTTTNPSVATVLQSGLITGVGTGIASIGVSSDMRSGVVVWAQVSVGEPFVSVTKVDMSHKNLQLYTNDEFLLTAQITPANASNKTVFYTSSDDSIVSVTPNGEGGINGLVKAHKAGAAVVTVRTQDGNYESSCQITVLQPSVPVSGVRMEVTNANLEVNQTYWLVSTVLPQNASNKTVIYSSVNSNIASVESNGRVTARSPGITVISVTTQDGGYKAFCEVIVTEPYVFVTSVKFAQNNLNLAVGQYQILQYQVLPENASNKQVSFSSSNSDIVSVSQNGTITGLSAGSASITVTTADSSFTDVCQVTVLTNIVPAQSLTLSPKDVQLSINETFQPTATILPENTTFKTLQYTSKDSGIASVDQNGVITAKKQGVTKIVATVVESNNVKDFITIKVYDKNLTYIIQDVSKSDVAYSSVLEMYKYNITSGCTSKRVLNIITTKYCPNDSIKRQQMGAFLYNIEGKPDFVPPAKSPFKDLPVTSQFYKEIMWGVSQGIWNGYSDGSFRPNIYITRAQLAATLYRYYGSPDVILPAKTPFKDVSEKSEFYKAIIWGVNNKIITGYADGTFKPSKNCSRAQSAMLFMRSIGQ
ncbi:MAG: Ig-like domain-containing protein, partial [Bifidobacteriaceae bacterium]|nr:Ig-like domain-containing protein [Bifidobacteriaceae bacterium]